MNIEAIVSSFIAALNAVLALFGKDPIKVNDKYGDSVNKWWEELQK